MNTMNPHHNNLHWHEFESAQALTLTLADRCVQQMLDHHRARGRAGIIVSGGSTPKPLLTSLSGADLPWQDIHVTLSDERCVPSDHPAANARMVTEHMLQSKAADAQWLSLTDASDPQQLSSTTLNRLKQFPWPTAVTVLGMGEDGHFASLFPNSDGLEQGLSLDTTDLAQLIEPAELPPDAPFTRVTLTLPSLINTDCLVLLIKGEGKKATLQQALQTGPVTAMPIRALLNQTHTPLHVYWSP